MSATSWPALQRFIHTVSQIGADARARGQLGEGGDPVWTLDEWRRFCNSGREYAQSGGLFSDGLARTIANVESLMAGGKHARAIHAALFWAARNAESAEAPASPPLTREVNERDRRINAMKDEELMRLRAREEAKKQAIAEGWLQPYPGDVRARRVAAGER